MLPNRISPKWEECLQEPEYFTIALRRLNIPPLNELRGIL